MPEIMNAMTVDVEDWFNATVLQCSGLVVGPTSAVERNTEDLLGLFNEHDVKATWFFLGEVAETYPQLVKDVAAAGHEPGVHGYHHHQVASMSRDSFREAVTRAKGAVESAGGVEVKGYRAVDFGREHRDGPILDDLFECGFVYDSSAFPFRGPRYGSGGTPLGPHRIDVQGGQMLELPVTVGEILGVRLPAAGGGYFRLFPLWYTNMLFKLAHASGRAVIFYIHPCEIEASSVLSDLPQSLTPSQRMCVKKLFKKQSKNRRLGRQKLKEIFARYSFGSIEEILLKDGVTE